MKKIIFKAQYFLCIALFFVLTAALPLNAAPLNAAENVNTGKLLSYQLFRTYSPEEVDWIMKEPMLAETIAKSGITFPAAKNGVNVYRLTYNTINTDGSMVTASGIVCLPKLSKVEFPLVSYQHGTTFNKCDAPFYIDNIIEAKFVMNVFSGQGYVTVMPDYIGQGKSSVYHPYLNAATEASASLDMLRAAKHLCKKLGIKLNGKLFITGYSQGGHSTAALQRLMEKKYAKEFNLTASAPLAGVYDLNSLWSNLIKRGDQASLAILARNVIAYNRIYSLYGSYSDIFKSPYDVKAPLFFDEEHNELLIMKSMPTGAKNLFREDFLKKTFAGKNRFSKELNKNSTYDWAPKSPTCFYNSKGDELVPYKIMESTYNHMKKLGGNVEMKEIPGGLIHSEAIVPAIFDAKAWFDSF